MEKTTVPAAAAGAPPSAGAGLLSRARALLERIPYSLLALLARGAGFEVFWRSGSVKLDDWAGTLRLFEDEYKVPLVAPHLAAYLSAGMELGGSVLLLAGLATRATAIAFLGMIAVIQVFVYPEAWPTHIQWVAFLLLLEPDPARPSLRAVPRRPLPHCHAQISGPCRQLARLANGEMDGDAMFFSRDLHISGNLEAVVCLRNALDDVDGSVMDCIWGMLPEPGRHLATRWRARGGGRRFARRLA